MWRLQIGNNRKDVLYLGYRLKLTECEYKIITAIAANESLTAEELALVIGLIPSQKSNVAVHVCSINKKASLIGGRKLIVFLDSRYRFCENM